MLRTMLLLVLGALLLPGCQISDVDGGYEVATLVLPEGHAVEGRATFRALGCASCHEVAWDEEMDQPVAAVPGPALDATLGRQPAGTVATSIIAPSHHVGGEFKVLTEDELSPMADFTEALTVRQLVDVVAYLRTQGGATVAQSGTPGESRAPF